VAATAVLSDATEPHERAGLLGFSDFAAIGTAAVGAVSSAAILGLVGVMALVLTGAAIAVSPLLLVSLGIGRSPRIPPAVP
ncbi:MAG TPA: hypothetical protein VKA30_02070, partial [Actinomycetota bacterium]|nr:hypothetical protein [Actinomycetota bacterium]